MKRVALLVTAVCLAHLPTGTFAQCAATTSISVPEKESITTIACERNGPVVFIWETFGELDDDEYFIYLEQNEQQIYSSGNWEIIGKASDQSQLIGATNGGTYFVRFRCDLEGNFVSTVSCDAATLKYTIVDCGCPDGYNVLQECSLASLDSATDAWCAVATETPAGLPISAPTTPPTVAPTNPPTVSGDADDDTEPASDGMSSGTIIGIAVCGALVLILAVSLGAKKYCECTFKNQSHKESSTSSDMSHHSSSPTGNPAAPRPLSPPPESEELIAVVDLPHANVLVANQSNILPIYLPHQKDQCRSVAPGIQNDNVPVANAVLIRKTIETESD